MSEFNPTPDPPSWRHQEISESSSSVPPRARPPEDLQLGGYSKAEPTNDKKDEMNKIQGYVLIFVGLIIVALLAWGQFRPAPKYEYKALSVQAQVTQKGESDQGGTSVVLKDEELSILGKEGWELVSSFLEMETTHPNFGNSTYVTGLQPNIRPQKAILVFRRRA